MQFRGIRVYFYVLVLKMAYGGLKEKKNEQIHSKI